MQSGGTKRAAARIERAAAWWRQNRLSAPAGITDDFEIATNLLAFEPDIGSKCESEWCSTLHRSGLGRVREFTGSSPDLLPS